MNRMEEYNAMVAQLEAIPAETGKCVARARARRSRSRILWRPLAGIAAAFGIFVGMVNLSPTVAAACMEIPLLEKLTEAVMFSPSLEKAVENEYVQPMGLEETQNGVTVRVEHVIVDQKQVNIFYTVTSAVYPYMTARADIEDVEPTGEVLGAGIIFGETRVDQETLRHIVVDFQDRDVPPQLRLLVDVRAVETAGNEQPTDDQWRAVEDTEPVAAFDLVLSFDPEFTAQGRVIEVNQTVNLNGNRFTVTDLEIYPTHIRINLSEEEDNPSWLGKLWFWLELEDGTVIEPISNGWSAMGNSNTPSMTTYMAESSFFYEAETFRLLITGADFREKAVGNYHLNLETGEHDLLPEGVSYYQAIQTNTGWDVLFHVQQTGKSRVQAFSTFYDSAGGKIEQNGMSSTSTLDDDTGELAYDKYSEYTYHLENFNGTEIWMEPNYTYFWEPSEPVAVEIAP